MSLSRRPIACCIDACNGLAPDWRQAIFFSDRVHLDYWRIYALLGLIILTVTKATGGCGLVADASRDISPAAGIYQGILLLSEC